MIFKLNYTGIIKGLKRSEDFLSCQFNDNGPLIRNMLKSEFKKEEFPHQLCKLTIENVDNKSLTIAFILETRKNLGPGETIYQWDPDYLENN